MQPILESKAIQEIGKLTDAKSYRQWNKKMKNALEQTRAQSRGMLEAVEKMTEEEVIEYHVNNECSSHGEGIIDMMMKKSTMPPEERGKWKGIADTLNRDMWAILCAKAESETEEKADGCNQGEGLRAYMRILLWFRRTTEQGKSLRRAAIMNPREQSRDGKKDIEMCRRTTRTWNCQTHGKLVRYTQSCVEKSRRM